ncbi:MAG: glycosyltransferase family 2 protein [Saprospiraceae bacterium]|nr:glycosyltransferase family 2 protein [Saprospiraceae bacterium]
MIPISEKIPEVSILMPYQNEEKHLQECIQSISDQSFKGWELLAVNDHSTDEGPGIVETWSTKDRRIHAFKNEGIGIIDALDTAYRNSKGKYITRMDADDIMKPDKLKMLKTALDNHGNGCVSVGQVEYFSDSEMGEGYLAYAKWLNNLISSGSNFEEIYLECPIPSPCWMMHRDDLEKCNAFRPDVYPEDYDLVFRMKERGLKIAGINKVLHQWRDHSDRSSRNSEHYADNRFTGLKLQYFIKHELKNDEIPIVWGAGKKGKSIARKLLGRKINFNWITDNDQKIGVNIYDKIIQGSQILDQLNPSIIIIAFSTFHDPNSYHDLVNLYPQHQFFRFF